MNSFKRIRFHNFGLRSIVLITVFALFFFNILLSYIFSAGSMDHPSIEGSGWFYKIESSDVGLSEGIKNNNSDWIVFDESTIIAPKNRETIIYYKTNLPAVSVADPHLFFETNDQAFEVYIEGKLIYSFGDYNSFNYKHSPGAPPHLISLPGDYMNKELIIAMKSVSGKRLGLIRSIELDSKGNHFMRVFKMNIGTLVLGCLNIIIGAACLFVGLGRKLGRKALFSLGSLFVIVGFWSIAENSLTQLFHFRPIFWFYIAITCFYAIPICVYKFIMDISNTNNKILNLLICLHAILFAVSFILDLAGVLAFINTMIFYYIVTGTSYMICVVVSIRSYLKGNTKALIYSAGQIIFGVFGVYDVLGWYFQVIPWTINMTPWGMLIFQLALLYALIQHLKDTQDRLIQYNEELKEKEKQIDQAVEYSKIRTEIFANVSHEMRTPLNIIHTTNQLMKIYHDKGIIGGKETNISKYINIMNQNCHRLMKLVNNLIDITNIESGFYRLNYKQVNIVSLIENITMSIEGYANEKSLKLIFDTELEEEMVECDTDAIERIMLNLLSNAVKFSINEGTIYVNIKIEEGNICIEVEDTGIGIPEDKLEVIFGRFVQVDKSFTRQNEGSGIGLAIVKALVELHNGRIEVKSEVNKGSKFTITLPKKSGKSIMVEDADYNLNINEKLEIEFSDIYYN